MRLRGQSKVAERIIVLYRESFADGGVSYQFMDDVARTDGLLAGPQLGWLANYQFDDTSPFHGMTISSVVRELKSVLESLHNAKFMAAGPSDGKPRPWPVRDAQLIWDKRLLEEAVGLYEGYESFVNKLSNSSNSDDLNEKAEEAAFKRLRENIVDRVTRAQVYRPVRPSYAGDGLESDILVEIRGFKEAEPLLAQLLDIFDSLDLTGELLGPVRQQASRLIRAADEELSSWKPYAVKGGDFSWWDGGMPVSLEAYDVGSPDELEEYLALQRQRIASSARGEVQPILDFLASRQIDLNQLQNVVSKWQGILSALDKYDKKVPGNSVTTLENFIRKEMDQASPDNCSRVMPQPGERGPAGDFFLETRNTLRRLLYQQCKSLAALNAAQRYGEIKDFFNRNLAGKFPFSRPEAGRRPRSRAPSLGQLPLRD